MYIVGGHCQLARWDIYSEESGPQPAVKLIAKKDFLNTSEKNIAKICLPISLVLCI